MIGWLWLQEAGFPMHGGYQTVHWRSSSARKLRLFNVACCRLIWSLVPDGLYRETVAAAERMADGLLPKSELDDLERRLRADFDQVAAQVQELFPTDQMEAYRMDRYDNGAVEVAVSETLAPESAVDLFPLVHEMVAVHHAGCWREGFDLEHRVGSAAGMTDEAREKATQELCRKIDEMKASYADILRCVWGNPFRPVAFSVGGRSSTAVAIASGMYEGRDFSAMPILADALEEAGCTSADILDHCRGVKGHCRGCWVVDLLLGKV
jgi:hypothetical protein